MQSYEVYTKEAEIEAVSCVKNEVAKKIFKRSEVLAEPCFYY